MADEDVLLEHMSEALKHPLVRLSALRLPPALQSGESEIPTAARSRVRQQPPFVQTLLLLLMRLFILL